MSKARGDVDLDKCSNCEFWFKTFAALDGFADCRRFPPTLLTPSAGKTLRHLRTEWPLVADDKWCGEFMRKE